MSGSVDLVEYICDWCNGTGEGFDCRNTCEKCKGSGVIFEEDEE